MHGFESKLLNTIRPLNLPDSMKPVVCVSGGKDSISLLRALIQIRQTVKIDSLSVLYIHHGNSDNKAQNEYRNKAKNFVLDFCKKWELDFIPNPIEPTENQNSEQEFRDFRRRCYRELLNINSNYFFWLGQHQNDQLETRLIRLIRGTGLKGLQAMKVLDKPYVRPLLNFTSNEITNYLNAINQSWLEDPSNTTNDYFRNWIRNHWLVELENYKPGSVRRLSESLSQIADSYVPVDESIYTNSGLDRLKFRGLPKPEQMQVLAQFCLRQGIKNYTQGQFNELLKHLDRDEKMFKLDIMKSNWVVDAKHINVLFKKQD